MKPIDKMKVSLVTLAVATFLVVNPFNITNDDGEVMTVSPFGWMVFGVITYFLARFAIVNYIEWRNSLPKRISYRHTRSHYNTTRKGK